ncbi:MAG: hypothetical protein F6K35_22460 [Okeania sp. SIO2H7]|nr:hypothetical protein [Okeania sp. SIO2H7]
MGAIFYSYEINLPRSRWGVRCELHRQGLRPQGGCWSAKVAFGGDGPGLLETGVKALAFFCRLGPTKAVVSLARHLGQLRPR